MTQKQIEDEIHAHGYHIINDFLPEIHYQNLCKNLDRRISCVYYLNHNWQPEHGGELILYHKDNQLHTTIQPYGNRLVCFNSDLPHEVSTSHRMRYSIAAWFKVRTIY